MLLSKWKIIYHYMVHCCLCLPAVDPWCGWVGWGLHRLLIHRLIGENIQSSLARTAGVTPSYGGMVGPWSVDISADSFLYGEDGWPLDLVSPCLYRLGSLAQNRQLGLNSNHFPPQIYLKYAASCLKTVVVALVWHKPGRGWILITGHAFSKIFILLSQKCRCCCMCLSDTKYERVKL